MFCSFIHISAIYFYCLSRRFNIARYTLHKEEIMFRECYYEIIYT